MMMMLQHRDGGVARNKAAAAHEQKTQLNLACMFLY